MRIVGGGIQKNVGDAVAGEVILDPRHARRKDDPFRIDAATGKAEIFDATSTPQAQLVQAARSCPYRAITVIDEAAGVQLFPPPPRQAPAPK